MLRSTTSEAAPCAFSTPPPTPQQALAICRKFSLRWVAVGALERQYYPVVRLQKFKQIGRVAHQEGHSILYQIDLAERLK